MEQAVGRHDPIVAPEMSPRRKIQPVPSEVSDSPARLFNHQRAGRLIPDGVRTAGGSGKSEKQVGAAAGQHDMLGLAIHQDRRRVDSEDDERAIAPSDIARGRFERPEDTRLLGVIDT
jgi:hypothetical protein